MYRRSPGLICKKWSWFEMTTSREKLSIVIGALNFGLINTFSPVINSLHFIESRLVARECCFLQDGHKFPNEGFVEVAKDHPVISDAQHHVAEDTAQQFLENDAFPVTISAANSNARPDPFAGMSNDIHRPLHHPQSRLLIALRPNIANEFPKH